MALSPSVPAAGKSPAYRLGALALLGVVAALATAWGFQLAGYAPCPLCLMQRWAYYFSIPALFLALVLLSTGQTRVAGLLFFLVSLAFLANSGLAVYHAGVEWKFWPGPETCSGGAAVTGNAADLLKSLGTAHVVRCDEAQIRILGLSFAGWNVIASFILSMMTLKAAFDAEPLRG